VACVTCEIEILRPLVHANLAPNANFAVCGDLHRPPPIAAKSDRQIIAGLKRRDPDAMADLYGRYGRRIYCLAHHIVGSTHVAEEITQDTFLRAWTRAQLISDTVDALMPWLVVTARNLAIDHLRSIRNQRCEYTTYESVPPPSDPQFYLSGHEATLRLAFDGLPAEQRTVIQCAYFEGLTQTEISERMGRSLGTVKTWARSALRTLRRSFVVSDSVLGDESLDSKDQRRGMFL
jgi:RNA polymerase sigma-70 factor (ECF subfamily)